MALTKIGKEGITGVSNSANATFLTATSAEGVTLAGTLAVTGVHTVGTNAIATSDGGAATTSIVQGLCKVWISLVQDSTHSINDSFNIGSIADNGAGETTCNYTNAMGNSNYAVAIARGNNQNRTVIYNGNNTSRLKLEGFEHASINSTADGPHIGATVHGDLA